MGVSSAVMFTTGVVMRKSDVVVWTRGSLVCISDVGMCK